MTTPRLRMALALALAALAADLPAAAEDGEGRFLVISDVHFSRLACRIAADEAVRSRYARFHDVGAPAAIPARSLDVYSCAITNLNATGLMACLAGAAPPTPQD